MIIVRRELSDVSEAVMMAAVIEDLGGSVFSICQDQAEQWHVFARFRSDRRAEKIDADFREIVKKLNEDFSDAKKAKRNRSGRLRRL